MSLRITSLNSGSNGNCYYIGNDENAILVDAGISCRETEKRMKRLGLETKKLRAIFVSHEHSDHIKGIPTLSKKYNIPVYSTLPTYQNFGFQIQADLFFPFVSYESVTVGNITVRAFPKHHDACDPHSFIVECEGVKVGVFTDIGDFCPNVINHFSQCHAAFLEANYDEEMLEQGRYPYYLKRRIKGGKGHLSNRKALDLFRQYKAPHLSHLFLSHLSKDNNCPQLVYELFQSQANDTEIIVASRFQETEVYRIGLENTQSPQEEDYSREGRPVQYSLF